MKGLRWLLVTSVLAVAGCDGGAKSPDFVPERTLTGMEIRLSNGTTPVPAAAQQQPAGTTEDYRAFVDVLTTVPPGYVAQPGETLTTTPDGKAAVASEEEVTTVATWTSNSTNIATVDNTGRVTGVAQGFTTIVAAYRGQEDSFTVEVTAATLAGGQVLCVRPATTGALGDTPCAVTTFNRPSGITVEFEAIGRFSDGQIRRIAAPYVVNWTSSNLPVAAKPASGNNLPLVSPNFATATVGATTITGAVVSGSDPLPNPASRTATLNVTSANEFCDTQFPAASLVTSQAGPLCLGCSLTDTTPSSITDDSLETFATLSIPLGLLTLSDISVTIESPTTIAAGSPVGFLLSRTSNDFLAAQLLNSLTVSTLSRVGDNLVQNGDPATNSEVLRLTLLGIRVPASPQFLLRTAPTTEPYDAVRLTFNAGLLSLLADVNVNTACSRARPEAAAP